MVGGENHGVDLALPVSENFQHGDGVPVLLHHHVHGQVDSGHTEDGAQEDHDQDDLLEVVDDRLDLILHRLLGVGYGHLAVLQFQLVVG